MLTNYLKISLRNLARHKAFSFINIFGLAISMSVCLLLIMLIKDAYSYDLFHPEGDRIYRILTIPVRKDGRTERYASSPFILGKTLSEEFPQAELWTPLVRSFNGSMEMNDKSFDFSGLMTDASFFNMFGFELEEGEPTTALSDPYTLVLTHELAERMFRDNAPVGATVNIPGYGAPFRVTGVLKSFPGKTHLDFTALTSMASQYAEEKLPNSSRLTDEWRDYYQTYNFVRLQQGANTADAERVLNDLAKTNYSSLELESRDLRYAFSLQPLLDITPGGRLSNAMGQGMPVFLLWFLGALGIIIIFSACFNYTNLTIARSLIRTKEIGVRKVLGASRSQVFIQILGEAVLTSFLSLVAAYVLLKLVKPQFERLSITEEFDVSIKEDWQLYAVFMLFTLLIGLIAGMLPALTLSKARPVAILQKLQNVKFIQRLGLRKALLTIQFTVTLIFLITLTIAWRQADHAISVNFGFDQPQTLLVETQDVPYDKVASALSQVSGVEKISGISFPMGTWRDASDDVRTTTTAEKTGIRNYYIDHNYLDHFGIKLVAGENFPENPTQQKEQFALVNETFVRAFSLGQPIDALGKTLYIGDSLQVVIQGVTEDFPFKPATYTMEPLLLRYDPTLLGTLNLQLNSQNIPATLAALENAWKKLDTDATFEAQFFDETARATYASAFDLIRIVGFFGFLGMIIACMGLLGLSIYTVETKAKEISIRKVMGANVKDVIVLLSKGYVWLFAIAVCMAVPVSYLLGNQLLQTFADRISWSIFLFLPGILLMLLLTGLTVCSQTTRAALANPVESLRSE